MSQPDTIWWCEEHKTSGHRPDHCAYAEMIWTTLHKKTMQPCQMSERRLVSPTALVVEKDESGEWPEWARRAIADLGPRVGSQDIFHALASSQRESQPTCDHNWVSARNEIIVSGEICLKCNAIRAEEPTQ